MDSGTYFNEALVWLRQGKRVTRDGWNGKGMFLLYIDPYNTDQYSVAEKSDMVGTLTSYIGLKTTHNKLVPWIASQTDLLANEWLIAE